MSPEELGSFVGKYGVILVALALGIYFGVRFYKKSKSVDVRKEDKESWDSTIKRYNPQKIET